jgi:long-chain fatty acid transport protein
MKTHMILLKTLLIVLSGFLTNQVLAGGLWLNEYGSPVQGRAGAGAQAGTDDASAGFFNPAAMSRLDESEIMLTAGIIYPTMEFNVDQGGALNGTGDGGDAGEPTPGGSLFYVHPLNDRWSLGLSGVALSGAGIDYDDDWAGRFQATEVDLLVIGLIPAISYRINDRLSVGVSVPVMYGDLTLKVAVPNPLDPVNGPEGQAKISGDDVEVAVMVGAMFELSQRTRLGLIYQSKFDFEFDGDIEIDPPDFEVGVDTELTFAPIVRFGLYHAFSDNLRGHMTLGWDGWSELDSVMLSTSSGGTALPRDWHDTYHSAAGVEYDFAGRWSIQGGVAYDTSPTNGMDRTADMPMDRQIRYAFGTKYRRDNGMTIGASLV